MAGSAEVAGERGVRARERRRVIPREDGAGRPGSGAPDHMVAGGAAGEQDRKSVV